MLCELCSGIHFQRLEQCNPVLREPERLSGVKSFAESVFYFHHRDKLALVQSARLGCHFCEMMRESLFGALGPSRAVMTGRKWLNSKYKFSRGEVILRRKVVLPWPGKDSSLDAWNRSDWIYVQCEDRSALASISGPFTGMVRVMLHALTMSPNLDLTLPVTILPAPDQSTQKCNTQDLIQNFLSSSSCTLYSPWLDISTLSPSSITLASLWLRKCQEKHQPCKSFYMQSVLPNRVISIKNPEHPHLEEGRGRQESYVTLSYKWGDCRRFLTTTKNLSAHEAEIPFSKLPWTFRDAIIAAHSLGFEWLWIDALCILQDSVQDQARQIEKMGSVFQLSTLTLFAASGTDANAGLSVMRDPRAVRPCRLPITTTFDGRVAADSVYTTLDLFRNNPEPLFYRGWVLQEEILARRALYFETRQIVWRCLCCWASESNPEPQEEISRLQDVGSSRRHFTGQSPSAGGLDSYDRFRLWLQYQDPYPDVPPYPRDNYFDEWYSAVEKYSSRSLTFHRDVLPALSGLASRLSHMHNCNYIAGLWKEDIQLGLCWYVTNDDLQQRGRVPLLGVQGHEPKVAMPSVWSRLVQRYGWNHPYRLTQASSSPSWSWISRWGELIRFHRWQSWRLIKHEGIAFVDEYLEDRRSRAASFAAIAAPSLKLIGRLRMAITTSITPEDEQYGYDHKQARWVQMVRDFETKNVVGVIALDAEPGLAQSRTIYCLLCSSCQDSYYPVWDLRCLALQPKKGHKGVYTRIGLVFMNNPNWWGGLTIIDPAKDPHSPPRDTAFLKMVTMV